MCGLLTTWLMHMAQAFVGKSRCMVQCPSRKDHRDTTVESHTQTWGMLALLNSIPEGTTVPWDSLFPY